MQNYYSISAIEQCVSAASALHSSILANVYYAYIRAIEVKIKRMIKMEPTKWLKPTDAILFKMKDDRILLKFKDLEEISDKETIDKIHFAVGHELGHLVLEHEFLESPYELVTLHYNGKSEKQSKEDKQKNAEANIFSTALFYFHVKTSRPHYKPSHYSYAYCAKQFKKSLIDKTKMREIFQLIESTSEDHHC